MRRDRLDEAELRRRFASKRHRRATVRGVARAEGIPRIEARLAVNYFDSMDAEDREDLIQDALAV